MWSCDRAATPRRWPGSGPWRGADGCESSVRLAASDGRCLAPCRAHTVDPRSSGLPMVQPRCGTSGYSSSRGSGTSPLTSIRESGTGPLPDCAIQGGSRAAAIVARGPTHPLPLAADCKARLRERYPRVKTDDSINVVCREAVETGQAVAPVAGEAVAGLRQHLAR